MDYSSSVMKLCDVTYARRSEGGRLACLGDTCAKILGKVDDDCIFDHPLAVYEGECNDFEPNFNTKFVKKYSVKEPIGPPTLQDVLGWENDEYDIGMMPEFMSTSIESSSPRSPMLEAWNGICNVVDETFSTGHIRKGTLEMNSICFPRKVIDFSHRLKIITPGLTTINLPTLRSLGRGESEIKDDAALTIFPGLVAVTLPLPSGLITCESYSQKVGSSLPEQLHISLPIPTSLGRSESEIKDDAALTIFPGLVAVTLPLPRRLENVVKTKDKYPIEPALPPIQLPFVNDLNAVPGIKIEMAHDVALTEVWDAECSPSLKEKDQYQYGKERQSNARKSNEGGREQTEYKIEDQECIIERSNTQGGGMENEQIQQNECNPFQSDSTISGNTMSVTADIRINSAKDIDSSMGMTTMNTLDSFNESRGIKNECVRVGALSNSTECAGLCLSEEFASVFNMEDSHRSSSEVLLLNGGNMHVTEQPEGVVPYNTHFEGADSRYNAQPFSKAVSSQSTTKPIGVCSSADVKRSASSSPPTKFGLSGSEVHEITAEQLWCRLKEVTAMLQPLLSRDYSQPQQGDWSSRVNVQREEYHRQVRSIVLESKRRGKDHFVAPIASTAAESRTSTQRSSQSVVSPSNVRLSTSLSPPLHSGDSFGRSGDDRKTGRPRYSRVKSMSSTRRSESLNSTKSPSPSRTRSALLCRTPSSHSPSPSQSPSSHRIQPASPSSTRLASPSPSQSLSSRRTHSASPSPTQSASPSRTRSALLCRTPSSHSPSPSQPPSSHRTHSASPSPTQSASPSRTRSSLLCRNPSSHLPSPSQSPSSRRIQSLSSGPTQSAPPSHAPSSSSPSSTRSVSTRTSRLPLPSHTP